MQGAILAAILIAPIIASSNANAADLEIIDKEVVNFVRAVNYSSTPFEGFLNHRPMRGVHVGESDGCSYVGVVDINRRRIKNFALCGETVTERDDVSPAMPNSQEFELMVKNFRRMALLQGHALGVNEGYKIKTDRLLTIQDSEGKSVCGVVNTIISYDELLVLQNLQKLCY